MHSEAYLGSCNPTCLSTLYSLSLLPLTESSKERQRRNGKTSTYIYLHIPTHNRAIHAESYDKASGACVLIGGFSRAFRGSSCVFIGSQSPPCRAYSRSHEGEGGCFACAPLGHVAFSHVCRSGGREVGSTLATVSFRPRIDFSTAQQTIVATA